MGFEIGACMGEVMESDIFETKEQGTFIKVLVLFYATKPLKSGISVASRTNGVSWVDFVYERLPQFCYSCGVIGHDEDGCNRRKYVENVVDNDAVSFGPWMRSSQMGRKIPNIDQSVDYHKRQTVSRKKQITFLKEVLNMLSSFSVTNKIPSPNMGNINYKKAANTESQTPPVVRPEETVTEFDALQKEDIVIISTAEETNEAYQGRKAT
ncbi:Zinc knuckle CX2CX4HX4C [Sesbania bispinosa]|nr:Zinc knuckle CX2CX4HX4C [Sesbania bispinosa]